MREQLEPNPKHIKGLTDVEGDWLRSRYKTSKFFPATSADCITCGGTKVFRWWSQGDPNEIVEYDCNCQEQFRLQRFFLLHGVPRANQTMAWMELHADPEAECAVKAYVDRMVANFRLGASIFLWGEPGTGKTMMGSLILKRALALKYDGYFTSFIDLMNGYSDGFDDRESRSRFNRTMMHADVLMIDDPGKEQHASAKQADYSSSVLDSVIRTRNGHSTPTIITSNDDPEAFKRRYGSYVSSLISERTLVQEVKGIDFREIQNKRLAIEIAENLSRPVVIG